MIKITRQTYPTDLKDQEWLFLEPILPPSGTRGRPQEWPLREVLCAIFYILQAGCAWRLLPHDLPPWQTVYYHFRKWQRDGTWEKCNHILGERIRKAAGREETPSAAIMDSQAVKGTSVKGTRGYDAGKKVKGRKRHIIVDTLGLLLLVVVTSCAVQDRDGAKTVLERLKACYSLPRLRLIWADGGYRGKLIEWVQQKYGWVLEIVLRRDSAVGFEVQPKRWIVERTFAWLNNYRRLSKEYEVLEGTSESFIYVAMAHIMVRKLAKTATTRKK